MAGRSPEMSGKVNDKSISKYLLLGVGIFGISWGSILTRLSGAPGSVCAAWRITFSAIIVLAFLNKETIRSLKSLDVKGCLLIIVAGVNLAAHLMLWMESLFYTSVAISTTIVDTHPITASLLTFLVLGEKPRRIQILGFIMAFTGVIIFARPWSEIGEASLIGILLALMGSISEGFYLGIGRIMRLKYPLSTYIVPVYVTGAVTSLVAVKAFTRYELLGYPLKTWVFFLLLALIPMMLGHTTMNYLMRFFRAITVTSSFLAEPVIASVLAVYLLGEIPDSVTIMGMAITLVGVLMVLLGEEPSRKNKPLL
ncbi:MAG TPA: DMT family transporter [Thermoprotei archaeon]|nr:DMT family transporter [Thermoprotei archaeon]